MALCSMVRRCGLWCMVRYGISWCVWYGMVCMVWFDVAGQDKRFPGLRQQSVFFCCQIVQAYVVLWSMSCPPVSVPVCIVLAVFFFDVSMPAARLVAGIKDGGLNMLRTHFLREASRISTNLQQPRPARSAALGGQELYDVLEMGQSIIFCRTKSESNQINQILQVWYASEKKTLARRPVGQIHAWTDTRSKCIYPVGILDHVARSSPMRYGGMVKAVVDGLPNGCTLYFHVIDTRRKSATNSVRSGSSPCILCCIRLEEKALELVSHVGF